MSISSYSELKTALANWLARDDLTSRIPEFITLFESSAGRRLATRRQEISTSVTNTAGTAPLPSDFAERRSLIWVGSKPAILEYTAPEYFMGRWGDRAAGTPVAFTIIGSNILVGPTDSTTLTLDYFATLAALSDSATTNWLLTNYPDAYLFGSLTEAFIFVGDADRAAIWKARADTALDEIIKLDAKTRLPSRVRIDGPVV